MSKCEFTNVIIIGYGRVTGEVIKKADECKDKYGYALKYIEYEVHDFNKALAYCEENHISHETIPDKEELTKLFMAITEPTLIVSASNNFLFPAKVLEKDNITVINFHNALLPKFPGRNATSWVIYEGEKETGITWHYVNADVDAGNIIIQKKTEIGNDTKAYELADILMRLAAEGFEEVYEAVLCNQVKATVQNVSQSRRIYKSKEVPGEAMVDMEDSAENIYRLLRAMDYGKNDIFPQAQAMLDGKAIRIIRYKKVDSKNADPKEGRIYLNFEDGELLMMKYAYVDEINLL